MGKNGKDSANIGAVVTVEVAAAVSRYAEARKWTKSKVIGEVLKAWAEGRPDLDFDDPIVRHRIGLPALFDMEASAKSIDGMGAGTSTINSLKNLARTLQIEEELQAAEEQAGYGAEQGGSGVT